MIHSQAGTIERRGLRKQPYSVGLGILVLTSTLLSVLASSLLAFDFLGYHAPGLSPHPRILGGVLLLGLSLAMVGQALGSGRNEGIRTQGWLGFVGVLLMRLCYAGLAFMGCVAKYALRGKHIPLYPVGVLTIVSGLFVSARFIAKFVLQLDRRRGESAPRCVSPIR
jgi:hypothetical protein